MSKAKFVRGSRPITSVNDVPFGYVAAVKVRDELGYQDYSRVLAAASHGVVESVKLVRTMTDRNGQVFIDPSSVRHLKKPLYAQLRQRLVAVRDGHVTETMKKQASQLHSVKGEGLVVSTVELQSAQDTSSLVDQMSVSLIEATPTLTQDSSRAERFLAAMENMVSLQKQTLAEQVEIRTSVRKLGELWA